MITVVSFNGLIVVIAKADNIKYVHFIIIKEIWTAVLNISAFYVA